MMMKAWVCPKEGAENLEIQTVPIPEPEEFDV